jgi:hypothetical protein
MEGQAHLYWKTNYSAHTAVAFIVCKPPHFVKAPPEMAMVPVDMEQLPVVATI